MKEKNNLVKSSLLLVHGASSPVTTKRKKKSGSQVRHLLDHLPKQHCADYILQPSSRRTESPLQNDACQAQQSSHDSLVSAHTYIQGDDYVLLIAGVIQEDRFHSFSCGCSKLLLFFPAIVFCGPTSISFTM